MKLDTKLLVLLAIYTEYQKDLPNMVSNITAKKLDMENEVFNTAICKLDNKNLINNALLFPRGGRKVEVKLSNMLISSYGIDYIEKKLGIDPTEDRIDKLKKIVEKVGTWGFEQVKDFASKTIADLIANGIK